MSDMNDNDGFDPAAQASPGELLRREREAQGLSREEVAVALNLRPAVVNGLETDSYDEVPVAAYRRGYLRAYARLLGIDDKPIIGAYNARFGSDETERRIAPVQVTKPPSRLGAWLFKLVTLLVVLGLAGLTLLWWQSRDGNSLLGLDGGEPVAVDTLDGTAITEEGDPAAGDPDANDPLPPLPDDSGEMGLVDEGGIAASGGASTEAAPAPSATLAVNDDAALVIAVGEQTAGGGAPAGDAAPADTPTSEPDAANEANEPDAGDARTLSLTFNEESWTEIFDANGERLYVGLQTPGTQASVEGEPPFRLTIGNASGVELRYRGDAVDLRDIAGSGNVARFTLGE